MSDLLGYNSLLVVTLLTYIFSKKWPNISNIIWIAFGIRISVLLLGHYFINLPDSGGDAKKFVSLAILMSDEGFFSVLSNFEGPKARFITWMLAVPFSLVGPSVLMAKSFSLLAGIGSVILGWAVANKIWNNQVANKVGWMMALFPSLILYSALVMREVYLVFFLILAIYWIVLWFKTQSYRYFFLIFIAFIGAIFFHGAMLVGLIIFLVAIAIINLFKILKSFRNFKLGITSASLILIVFLTLGLFITNKISVPYLHYFENSARFELIQHQTRIATRGDASWPKWTVIKSPIEVLYKAPIRSLYFVFTPLPWDVKKTKHLIGMFDSWLYLFLSILILINIKDILSDPILRIILLILLTYLFVFGIGVGNFGTGIRHRSKFVFLFILLAAPYIRNFKFIKNQN